MAAGDTTITLIGNLVDDPELRFTPSGAAVAKFRVASTPRFFFDLLWGISTGGVRTYKLLAVHDIFEVNRRCCGFIAELFQSAKLMWN